MTAQALVDGSVGTLKFANTPRNCLDKNLLGVIDIQFSRLLDEPKVKSILITADHAAGGGCFCAGMDVKLIHAFSRGPRADAEVFLNRMMEIGLKIDRSPKPVVAYVDGPCFGGGMELALCCDLIIAGPKAQFALPEIKLGIFPGWGGTQRLLRRIGFTQAAKMILSGEAIDADTASEIGLINARGPIGDIQRLMTEVGEAPHIVLRHDDEKKVEVPILDFQALGKGRSASSVAIAYSTMSIGSSFPFEAGLRLELSNFLTALGTADAQEGLQAFVEKRKPNFTAVY